MDVVHKEIRCKSSTDPNKLGASIYSIYQEDPDRVIHLRVVGAGALNQAIKGVIISNTFFSKKGLVSDVRPSFTDADGITAVVLKIIVRGC